MEMKKILMLILPLFLLLCACSPEKAETLQGEKYPYSVEAPHGWEVCESLNPLADGSMQCEEKRLYMIVLCEDRKDFDDSVDIAAFTELSKESMTLSHEGAIIRAAGDTSYTCACTVDSVRVRFYVCILESEEVFYQLVFWTAESDFDNALSEFEKIADAFTVG